MCVLSVVTVGPEAGQTVVGDLQDEAIVHDTVGRLEFTVRHDHTVVEEQHPLKTRPDPGQNHHRVRTEPDQNQNRVRTEQEPDQNQVRSRTRTEPDQLHILLQWLVARGL